METNHILLSSNVTYLQGSGIVETNCTTGAVSVLVADDIHCAKTVPPIPIIAFYNVNISHLNTV